MGDQGIGRSPWRRQICSAERKSNRRRNIRQRQGLTTDGAHGRQSRRDCGRSGRLGPAAAQCIEATTDHVADTHPQWIPSGLVDQRHCQIDHYRRRAATCARRRGGDPVGDRVRSHWPDRGRDWGLAGRPRHLAGLRQAPFCTAVFLGCRRGTRVGDARRTRMAVRHPAAARLGRHSRVLAWRPMVAPPGRRRAHRTGGHHDRSGHPRDDGDDACGDPEFRNRGPRRRQPPPTDRALRRCRRRAAAGVAVCHGSR